METAWVMVACASTKAEPMMCSTTSMSSSSSMEKYFGETPHQPARSERLFSHWAAS
jgi:hypothetical protein